MKSKSLLLVCFVMLSTVSVFAQSSATDAISGTWTGHLGPGATPQFAVTLELRADGKGAVSGTLQGLPSPGEIKSGTFDPQTGALKLEAAPTNGSALRLILEGTVVLGTVTSWL